MPISAPTSKKRNRSCSEDPPPPAAVKRTRRRGRGGDDRFVAATEAEPLAPVLVPAAAPASSPGSVSPHRLRALRQSESAVARTLGLDRSSPCAQTQPAEARARADALRRFAHELVASCGEGDDEARAQAVRGVIAAHPEIFSWLIEGWDLTAIIADAELPQLPPTMHRALASVPAVGRAIRDGLTKLGALHALAVDVDAARTFYGAMSRGSLLSAAAEVLPGAVASRAMRYGRGALLNMVVEGVRRRAGANLEALTVADRVGLLGKIPDAVFVEAADQVNSGIAEAKFSESEAIAALLDPEEGFDLSTVPPAFAEFFELVLTQYFDRLPVQDKRRICLAMLELPPHAPTLDKLASILDASGPAIQKMMQLLGNDVKTERMAATMRALKSNIKAFPTDQAIEIIERDLGDRLDAIFDQFNPKPLAAASIGQVYAARLRASQEEVIVKVMRPGLPERARREIDLLRALATSEGVAKIVDKLEESLFEELDLRIEAANLEKGEVYFQPRRGIQPVFRVGDMPTTRSVLLMGRAYDQPINKLGPEDLRRKSEALGSLLETWFEEAIFGTGFFHGDLHAGNIFFSPEAVQEVTISGTNSITRLAAPKVEIGPAAFGRDFTVTLIDFGCAGQFTPEQRGGLIDLLVGLTKSNPDTAMAAFRSLCTVDAAAERALRPYLEGALREGRGSAEILDELVNRAVELGCDLPKALILFNRGRAFLEKQIEETNQALDAQGDTSTPRVDPAALYQGVVTWRLVTGREPRLLGKLLFG